MIDSRDEYLHEPGKSKEWVETFSINFIDRKNKIFGYADINYYFQSNKCEFSWSVFYNNKSYNYNNSIDFNGNLPQKIISDKKLRYKIITPQENFELALKSESINASLSIAGVYPIYVFPTTAVEPTENKKSRINFELPFRYEQRCKISGSMRIIGKEREFKFDKLECYGHRKHLWGKKYGRKLTCYNWITVHFRDMTMNLTHLEFDDKYYSNGFISRRTGNIPIVEVEPELISFSQNDRLFASSEFSYKDAQDDRDLIVSKRLHSIELPIDKSVNSKFIRARSFSEFTIIGTNKKGIGMEEHYVSRERLKKME